MRIILNLIKYSEMDKPLLKCNDTKEGNKNGKAIARSRDVVIDIKVSDKHGENGIKDKDSNVIDNIDKEKDDKVASSDGIVANDRRVNEEKNKAKGTPEDGEVHDRQEFIDDGTLLCLLLYESGEHRFRISH